jgi:hypothetical protein
MIALRHAPDVALVWPRALDTARSAEPLLAEARARGGFAYRIRSRSAGSFAVSVDTALAVWSLGHPGRAAVEASVPLDRLRPRDVAALALPAATGPLRLLPEPAARARGAITVGAVAEVRFGMKSGCNAFFHLRPLEAHARERHRLVSELVGEVTLTEGDCQPLLASLKEASAPELAHPTRLLFRPTRATVTARRYIAAGEALGVALRPTCRGRGDWWLVAPGRRPAPVLYPAKIGARAFAVLNERRWWEDKKWHALFPREGVEPWLLALVLGATPVRLAVDRAARQLTGAQAIADVDCRILAAAAFPSLPALRASRDDLHRCREALARDPVTTDLRAMLDRPAQEELDRIAGSALGLTGRQVVATRREMIERVAGRLEHAAHVRAAIAGRDRQITRG